MSYSKGIFWLDDCRIPFVDDGDIKSQARAFTKGSSSHKGQAWNNHLGWEGSKGLANPTNQQGRFTPNLLVCDDMLNDGNVSKSNSGGISSGKNFGGLTEKYRDRKGVDDKGTNSRYYSLDLWFNKMINNL
jgi:hypothetical protein